MPRKTKDQNIEEIDKVEEIKKAPTKKTSSIDKKTSKKTSEVKKVTKTTTKKVPDKKPATTKTKESTKKTTTAKTTKKSTAKSTTKKSATTKSTTRKKTTYKLEYYDLPFSYEKTVVKILSQTPNSLFVYWELSSKDADNLKLAFGNDFFYKSKPVLIVTNITLDYTFEIDINDFANSWYITVNDANCEYIVKLGRRPVDYIENLNSDYVHISESNNLEFPNDRILSLDSSFVNFKNIKTSEITKKDISFMPHLNTVYTIFDIYKKIYNEDITNLHSLNSPSSHTYAKENI